MKGQGLEGAGLDLLLAEAAEAARYLWEKGWAESNAGNISVDATEAVGAPEIGGGAVERLLAPLVELGGRTFWVSAAGSRMRDLARAPRRHSGLLQLTPDGAGLAIIWAEQGFRPTSELPSHLAIHAFLRRRCAPQKAIIHTHPTELIALSHLPATSEEQLNRLLWRMIPEAMVSVPEGLGLVPFHLPGSQQLAEATERALGRHRVVLWEKHGALAIGSDPIEAFDLIDTLNKSAQLYLACKAAGFAPRGLSEEQLAELRRVFLPRP
ncbi:MAG: rhamnulose-1-phosphate aldolase [Acidobacteriota bacterium]